MRYRVMGAMTGRSVQAFVVAADTLEEARLIAERDGIRVENVAPIDEAAESGERWFVGATGSVLLAEAIIVMFVLAATVAGPVVQQAVAAVRWAALDEPLFRSVTGAAIASTAVVVLLVGPTLLLAQGTFAGSRLARKLDLIWAGVQIVATLLAMGLVVAALAGSGGRREGVLWSVPLAVGMLRLAAYVFLGGVLLRSAKVKTFLDEQAKKRVQTVTVTSVTLLVLVILSLIALAVVPFVGV